jgi:hypothetical protein
MKRLSLILGVILLVAVILVLLQRRLTPHARQVAGWLPGTTILFEDMPDIHRTAERWPDTELAQIIAEPEVQAFLQRPLSQLPRTGLDQWFTQLRSIDPLHVFLAVTSWSGTSSFPSTIAGVDFAGSKGDMDTWVDNLRKTALETWPEGKSDIVKYGSGDIETFTTPNFTAALAYRGQWLFIATDAALLKSTLDRFEGQHDPNSLAELPAFQSSLQHLPSAFDSIFFLRPALLADPVASFALMLNPTADVHATDDIKKIDAVSIAFKLDGPVMRDASFIIKSDPAPGQPLARDALKLASKDTIVLLCERAAIPGDAKIPDPKTDPSGILELLASYLKIFSDQGLGQQQFSQAFGPESGFVLDWGADTMIPTPFAMLDVRDPALARKFLDTLAALPLAAGVDFTRQDAGPISLYSLPPTGIGFFPIQLTLGLTDKCVIGALNIETVKQAAERWKAGDPGLAASDDYKKATALVSAPETSFAYIDAKAIFGRAYGLFRGVASMGMVPHLAEYVDLGKLPAQETITRHLTPIVASGSIQDGGLLNESAGPVSSMQATLFSAAAIGAIAFPMLEQQLKGQSVTIPGLSGFNPFSPNSTQNPFPNPLFSTPTAPSPAGSPP